MSTASGVLAAGGGSHRRPSGVRREQPTNRVSRPGRPAGRLLGRMTDGAVTGFLLVAVVAFLVLGVGPHFGGYRTETMLTGSMAPGIPVGAVLITTAVPTSRIHVGDVVTIQAPVPDHHVVTHRVIAIEQVAGQPAIRTKGDANVSPDPWLAKISGSHISVVRTVIPGAGQSIRWLRSPTVHNVTVYGLPALVVGWLLWGIWRGGRAPSSH